MSRFPESFYCPITKRIMRDPVQDPDGNTFERAAIERWLTSNRQSPITRNNMTVNDLVANRALKDIISREVRESGLDISTMTIQDRLPNDSVSDSQIIDDEGEIDIGMSITADRHTGDALISITPPARSVNGRRPPVDLCCVIDISGSMDSAAEIKKTDENGNEMIENTGLTILDVVKHALRTVISNLNEGDRMSLVTFSSSARKDMSLKVMNERGRGEAVGIVDGMRTEGSTNLWDGLKQGMETLAECRSSGSLKNNSLFLLTDGQPNVEPPRGSVEMFKKYKDEHDVSCTVNTFGFGYHLNSDLLDKLAVIGGGTYNFIPDGGMVGTIFVSALSNLMMTIGNKVSLKVEAQNAARLNTEASIIGGHESAVTSWGLDLNLGTVQYGQTKDVLINMRELGDESYIQANLNYHAWNSPTLTSKTVIGENIAIDEEDLIKISRNRNRLMAVDVLREGLNDPPGAKTKIDRVVDVIRRSESRSEPDMVDLLKDLTDQGTLAFQNQNNNGYFNKWGRHYIASLSRAHLIQQSNNFKDPGVQHYGGDWFKEIRDQVDRVFDNLPPAVPSRQAYDYTTQMYRASRPVSMSSYNSRGDPCVRGDATVELHDGKFARLDELKKGDVLKSGAAVRVVVKTKIPGQTSLCNLSTPDRPFFITPWHPVLDKSTGEWMFPTKIVEPQPTPCTAIYSFILDKVHEMDVADRYANVTLGHDYSGDIREHLFFGSQKVIDDLKSFDGFEDGLVLTGGLKRNLDTDEIVGFNQP